MIKQLLSVLVCIAMVQPCSVGPNYVWPTLEEEISFAGAIARGRVFNVIGDQNGASVVLDDVVFYRGQGPSSITVDGFKGSSLCGTGIPSIGVEIFVFLCRDDGVWYLNNIAVSTGAISANDENNAIINKELPDNWLSENSSQIRYKQCRKRGDKPFNESPDDDSDNDSFPVQSFGFSSGSSSGSQGFQQSSSGFKEFANSFFNGQFTG